MKNVSIIRINHNDKEKVLNILRRHRIDAFNVFIDVDYVNISLYSFDLYKVKYLFKRNKLDYQIILENNFGYRLKNMSNYLGIIIGLVFVSIFSWVYSSYVFKVKVECEDFELSNEVLQYVKANIMMPTKKNVIDDSSIELAVVSNFKNVAFCEVEIEEETLVVQIEKVRFEDNEEKHYTNIIANCDSIITEVIVTSGTALVKAGDVVKKGEVLIEWYIKSTQNENEKIKVEAAGVVYGRTWFDKKLSISKSRLVLKDTGEEKTIKNVSIFNHVIFKKSVNNTYNYYTLTKSYSRLYGILPIYIETSCYREAVPTVIEIGQDEIEEIIANTKIEMLENIGEKRSVVDSWVLKKEVDNLYLLDIYYEVEQCISIGEE